MVRALRRARDHVRGAGHSAYTERHDVMLATIRAFIEDRPLPFPVQAEANPPQDLNGPR